ncbi:hypothetical protein [Litorimonas sp. WD9-15]|uniref:hypothetical protein n=1 Tax=Litorimonas sp. WD9-15 TaxID=3418716 RepID=UPI003D02207B
MDISAQTPTRVWTFGSKSAPVELTLNAMTALDDDIAIQTAAKWFGELATSAATQAEFGLPVTDLDAVIADVKKEMCDVKAYSRYLYSVALAVRLVRALTGLKVEGEVAQPTRRTFAILFKDTDLMNDFLKIATKRFHAQRAAGNA